MKAPDVHIDIGSCEHGKTNSITDIGEIRIGHCTLIKGEGALIPGKGPVRTGVTAVLPHTGNVYKEKLLASTHIINGYCKPIGLAQVKELGVLETPVILTNTLSVGICADTLIEYMLVDNDDIGVTTGSVNPVVMECNDSYLNDIRGNHINRQHIIQAIECADTTFAEGAVGAGTGMSAFEFKGGIGSSSRIIEIESTEITVGALVLSNFGKREDLAIAGVPVGKELLNWPGKGGAKAAGSIIIIVATDAFLTARQLQRVARRADIGLARTGGYAYHGSGDVVLAFSTSQKIPHYPQGLLSINSLPDSTLNPLFKATAEAVEEAILNSLLQAETVKGRDDRIRYQLPTDELMQIMAKYGRITEKDE
ncbi:MAG: P1 family peptidase [Theionarchaea archaeon]|nr:MAG: aminopeptidase [Theionarchaea archaeon DG-70]MBU7011599.1 P1 family peptidase [Theionarchaea archaeon]